MKTILRFSRGHMFSSYNGEPLASLVIDGHPCCIGQLKSIDFGAGACLTRVETESYVYVLVEGEGE